MLAPFLLTTFVLSVSAQSVHDVIVGVQGSFFVPPTTSAREGDLVNFIFGGDIHTLTQGTFENPCTYLKGGFDSGLLGRGPEFDKPTQVFSLTITNASEPIWFHCAATIPYAHCTAGMVGVINPPSQDVFDSYLRSAKLVEDVPKRKPEVVTNGIGATAAAPSTISDVFPTATPATLTDPSIPITTLPGITAPSITPEANDDDRKTIIGGAVGGAVGLIVLVSLSAFLFFCIKKKKRSRQQYEQHMHPEKNPNLFAYNQQNPQLSHQQSFFSDSALSNSATPNTSPNYATTFNGAEHGSLSPQAMMQSQPLLRGNTASPPTVLASKKANMPLQPLRHADSQGTVYNRQPQEYEVAALAPVAHDVSMSQQQNVTIPSSLPSLHPLRLQPQDHQHQQEYTHHQHGSSVTTSDPGDGINLKALAREVAAVLKKDSSNSSSSQPRSMKTRNPDNGSQGQELVSSSHNQSRDTDSLRYDAAPPKYHSDE
ncbi:hypothetical protein AGABI2DRAFT_194700 [Agaricus bisporus var. bisporus H97]|uniref:hypothetical protein n=1 Tax=Agaricus bisporus var. bisporus (strain H97 / ATCC MYA-4626 / FGSC 10389) TaxID=936046 RepID=UPI00029F54F6|nr:hypothetical protein AGABI2DRAFT_194700 [Agaricus bisporus var. bisporus H97]EKV44807.1 hypothetical protein AGABI2DRAFT_194700 [Agaricus bisporus var. bisporus H97]